MQNRLKIEWRMTGIGTLETHNLRLQLQKAKTKPLQNFRISERQLAATSPKMKPYHHH